MGEVESHDISPAPKPPQHERIAPPSLWLQRYTSRPQSQLGHPASWRADDVQVWIDGLEAADFRKLKSSYRTYSHRHRADGARRVERLANLGVIEQLGGQFVDALWENENLSWELFLATVPEQYRPALIAIRSSSGLGSEASPWDAIVECARRAGCAPEPEFTTEPVEGITQ